MYQRVYAVTRLLLLSARDDMTLERLNPIPSHTAVCKTVKRSSLTHLRCSTLQPVQARQ